MTDGSPFATLVVQWFGMAMLATFIYVLARAHWSSGTVNLSTLILDKGVVTLAKFGGLLFVLASSWIVVLLAIKGTLTGEIFGGWMFGLTGMKIAGDFTRKMKDNADEEHEPPSREPGKDAPGRRGR